MLGPGRSVYVAALAVPVSVGRAQFNTLRWSSLQGVDRVVRVVIVDKVIGQQYTNTPIRLSLYSGYTQNLMG